MDIALSINSILFVIIFKIYGSYSITVLIDRNISGVIGECDTRIQCSYTRHSATKIFTIELKANNDTIVTFLPNEKPRFTTKGQYLEGRVTLMNISKVSTEAVMIFDSLICDDQTNYSCSIVYLDKNGRTEESHSGITTLYLKVPPSKPEYVAIVHVLEDESTTALQIQNTTSPIFTEISTYNQSSTSANINEGDIITCICAGDVGKPPGKFVWQNYRHGEKVPMNYTHISTITTEVPDNCSYYGTSYLQLRVTALDNQAIIRCFIDSPLAKPYMYVDMKPMDVMSFSKDTTTLLTSSYFTGSEIATGSHSEYIGIGIGVLALVLLIVYGIYIFIRNRRQTSYAVQRESTNSNLCIIDPPTQQIGHCEIISMTNDIDKEISVGAAVTINDPKLPSNENLTRQGEDEDNDNPTSNTSPVTTVCVNAQLKKERKFQISNGDNKVQS